MISPEVSDITCDLETVSVALPMVLLKADAEVLLSELEELSHHENHEDKRPLVHIPNRLTFKVVGAIDTVARQYGAKRVRISKGVWVPGRTRKGFTKADLAASDETDMSLGASPGIAHMVTGSGVDGSLLHFLGLPFDEVALQKLPSKYDRLCHQIGMLREYKATYEQEHTQERLGAINTASIAFMALTSIISGRQLPLKGYFIRDLTLPRAGGDSNNAVATIHMSGGTQVYMDGISGGPYPKIGVGIGATKYLT